MRPGPRSLPALLRAVTSRHPERVALTGSGLRLTYGQLDACVSRLAADFAAVGLRPGDRVGLGVRRGVLPLVLSAALMRAGCAYVPLDVQHPVSRLQHIVDGAGLRTAVCDEAGQTALRPLSVSAVLVEPDDVRSAAELPPVEAPLPPVTADMTAYVMFTSGSSGVPKGVAVTHGNVMALLEDALPLFAYGADESWPLIHGFGFDVSVWEMWAGIAVGARLAALDGTVAASPPLLADTLVKLRPTRLHIVPSVFRHLVDAMVADSLSIHPRGVVFCGEAIDYHAIRTWTDGMPGPAPQWVNVYGITETTVYNTIHTVTPGEVERAPAATPVGHAYSRSPAVVLDADRRLMPVGEAGEIFIGGLQVSPGYLGNAALTAERFSTVDALPGRWYRTGDLGFVTEDGALHCAGRADDQIKVRGLRIELGEIDSALRSLPWVRDAAAVVERRPRGEAVITACVVPADGTPTTRPEVETLRTALSRLVPAYMLPNKVAVLDRLPQNSNGKTDRRALADIARAGPASWEPD